MRTTPALIAIRSAMTYISTLPARLLDAAVMRHEGARTMPEPQAVPLRCVQSRLARPPVVQLPPTPSALNRELQKRCLELQQLVAGMRRCALEQANRELIHRQRPGPLSKQRLQAAQAQWVRHWTDLMEQLDQLQAGLPDETRTPRDRKTVMEAHRLTDSIRLWALGFRADADLGLDIAPAHGGASGLWRWAAGITGTCQ